VLGVANHSIILPNTLALVVLLYWHRR